MEDAQQLYDLAGKAEEDGDLPRAMAYLERVVDLEPAVGPFWARLGCLQEDAGDHEQAIVNFRRAIELNNESAGAHSGLGRCLHVIGRHEEALEAYRTSIQLKPAAHRFCLLAGFYLDEDRIEEAMQASREALKIEPDYEEAFYQLALAHREIDHRANGEGDEEARTQAIKCLREAVRLDPDYRVAWHELGSMLVRDSHTRSEGIEALRKAIKLDIDREDMLSRSFLATAFWTDERLEEADEQYRAAIAIAPDSPEARCWYARFLICCDRDSESLQQHYVGWKMMADRPEDDDFIAGQLRRYREDIEDNPEDAYLRLMLANALWRTEAFGEAEVHYEAAVELDASLPEAFEWFAQFLEDVGRATEAEAIRRQCPEQSAR